MKKLFLNILTLVLIASMLLSLTSCGTKVKAADLMEGIKAEVVEAKEYDDKFLEKQFEFNANFFKRSASDLSENVFVSPLSAQLALAMVANGADGDTLSQMETMFGGIKIDDLNKYLKYYQDSLTSSENAKFNIANSVWYRDADDFNVNKDFLIKNASFYRADAYLTKFDSEAVVDINNWASKNTDGMIEKVVESFEPYTMMYLMNAIVFDAKWEETYKKESLVKGYFSNLSGELETVTMMSCDVDRFLKGDDYKGFVKDYVDGKYSFVAILPNLNVSLDTFISTLNGKKLSNILTNAQNKTVYTQMPKFTCEYDIRLNSVLSDMGMTDAFLSDKANFSKMSDIDLFISEVRQKTYIEVSENGTKAAAVTSVNFKATGAMDEETVVLNRPYLYMIVDNDTNLPIFMGAMTSVNQ